MSIVVIMDGFEYEGWRNLSTLFEPSFNNEGLAVYYKSDNNLEEIEDLLPMHNHTLIFVFPLEENEIEENDKSSRIELFRYKNYIKQIAESFPYYKDATNFLLTIDMTTSRQYKIAKREAKRLETTGMVENNDFQKTYFASNDLSQIDDRTNNFIENIQQSHDFTDQDIKDFDAFKISLLQTTQEMVDAKTFENTTKEKIKQKSSQLIQSLTVNHVEKNTVNIAKEVKKVLLNEFTIFSSLKDFTLINYAYNQEISSALYLNLLSVFSIIHNCGRELNHDYWFQVETITSDNKKLSKNINQLLETKISNKIDKTFKIEINDISSITFDWQKIKIPSFSINSISIPFFNSPNNKEAFQHEVNHSRQEVSHTIKKIKEQLQKTKHNIYNLELKTTQEDLSFEKLEVKANKKIKQESFDYKDSINEIEKTYSNFGIQEFTSNCLAIIGKLPKIEHLLIIAPALITLLVFLPLYIIHELLENKAMLIIVGLTYIIVSFILISKTRNIIKYYLKQYYEKMNSLLNRVRYWQDNTVIKFKAMFKQKLAEENQLKYKNKLFQIKQLKAKIDAHKLALRTKKGFAQSLSDELELKTKISDKKLIKINLNQAPAEVLDLALFPEKFKTEVIIDKTKVVKPMIYGTITEINFEKVTNREDYHD